MNKKRNSFLILIFFSFILIFFSVRKENIALQNTSKIEDKTKQEFKEPVISNIKLIAAGDIMVHSPQFRAAYNYEKDTYDFGPVFRHVKKHIQDSDIALVNLETVIGGENIEYSGFPNFNTPKEILKSIKEAGFSVISTANNHSLDQGKNGLINTIDSIEEYGLKNIGTYKENKNILIEEIQGIKLGLLSYTYGVNKIEDNLTKKEVLSMVNFIDEENIKRDIEATKKLDADLTIVFIHWGNEYHRDPSEYQIDLGEKIISWGGDIILGSHPHVVQRGEIIKKHGKDKFIIYSLGNLLSNQRYSLMENSYTEDGLILSLNIEKDFSSGETLIRDIEYIPTWVYKYRKDQKLFYEILPIKDVLENKIHVFNLDKIEKRIEKSYENTMKQVIQY